MKEKYINSNSSKYWAFNIWDDDSAQAVLAGAVTCKKDIILQTSMKSFSIMDKERMRFGVSKFNSQKDVKSYLHLDHCTDIQMIHEAIENGWDSVMIDVSDKSLHENIDMSNQVSEFAHQKNVLVEAEIGKIQGVEETIASDKEAIAELSDVKEFIEKTDIDMLAVAIGTAHGKYKGTPNIRYELIDNIRQITRIPLVIHGGSGLTDEMFIKLMSFDNIKKINVSTDVKLAYRDAIRKSFTEGIYETDTFNPLIVKEFIHKEIMNMVIHKLEL